MTDHVIIIGGGQAGAQAVQSLRQAKFEDDITLIGSETHLPYQRPPLSKAYLKGELQKERLFLRPRDFFDTQNVKLHLGDPVTEIARDEQRLKTESGAEFSYTGLLLATGAPPRRLTCEGADLEGVHYLRTLDDSDALSDILKAEGAVVIIGGGYIGLEVAAVARAAGRKVIVIEMADRVLARVASEPVSKFYQDLHEKAGVEIRCGAAVESLGGDKRVETVVLSTGETIECAAVLVGIGAIAETALASATGLEVENGIVVDDHARTSDPYIWAAGDCTNFPSPRYGRRLRLESVPNAIEQAKAAAANMAGGDVVYDSLPWFWSDQYDVKLQTVGLSEGHDQFVVRGSPADKKFSVWYLKDGQLLCVDAINDPAAFALARIAITNNVTVDPASISEMSDADLKAALLKK